jgi:hypothetical protein
MFSRTTAAEFLVLSQFGNRFPVASEYVTSHFGGQPTSDEHLFVSRLESTPNILDLLSTLFPPTTISSPNSMAATF